MLRLRGALREPWMEDVPVLRRFVIAGRVTFDELREVASDIVSVWDTVREYVRYAGPRHIKSSFDKVGCIRLQFCSLFSVFFFNGSWPSVETVTQKLFSGCVFLYFVLFEVVCEF